MEQFGKAKKFCLSRRIEEYYFEESFGENQSKEDSDDDYSTIYNLIHQRALKRTRKCEIENRVGAFYDQQKPAALNFTSDSVYASSDASSKSLHRSSVSFNQQARSASTSFNRRRFDVLSSNVNYIRPNELHKQRQSDVLPLDRYERIMEHSPFDSPLTPNEQVHRRATIMPAFKTFCEQATQTSYRNSSKQAANENQPIERSQSTPYRSGLHGRSASSMRQEELSTPRLSSIHQSSANKSSADLLSGSMQRSINKSTKSTASAKKPSFVDSPMNASEKSTLNKLQDVSNRSKASNVTGKRLDRSEAFDKSEMPEKLEKSKKSERSEMLDKSEKLNKSEKMNKSENLERPEVPEKSAISMKSKRKSHVLYDKSNYISFSRAHIHEPDDEQTPAKHAQTEVIESLNEDSTFKTLNSLISKKSVNSTKNTTKSAAGQTENYTGSFGDPTKLTANSSLRRSNLMPLDSPHVNELVNELEHSKAKDASSRSRNASTKNVSKSETKQSVAKPNETPRRKSILKKSVAQIEDEISLIFNSTVSEDEPSKEPPKQATRLSIRELSKQANKLSFKEPEQTKASTREAEQTIKASTREPEQTKASTREPEQTKPSAKESEEANKLNAAAPEDDLNESLRNLENLEQINLSAIGMDSDVECVFDLESTAAGEIEEPHSQSRFNEEIELARRSDTQNSIPPMSLGTSDLKSISETLSPPDSVEKTVEKSGSNEASTKKTPKRPEQTAFTVDFNSEREESKPGNEPTTSSTDQQAVSLKDKQLDILKSTPKSILKNSAARRAWDVSDFSLVDLTAGSSLNKSTSGQRNQKNNNSVRFSDDVSEKFTSNLLRSSSKKARRLSTGEATSKPVNPSISRSLSKEISKSLNESINRSLSEALKKSAEKPNEKSVEKLLEKPAADDDGRYGRIEDDLDSIPDAPKEQLDYDMPNLDGSFEFPSSRARSEENSKKSIERSSSKQSSEESSAEAESSKEAESSAKSSNVESSNKQSSSEEAESSVKSSMADEVEDSVIVTFDEDSADEEAAVSTDQTKWHQDTFTIKSIKKQPAPRKPKRLVDIANIRKQPPKYYETFVDKTPTIIYPEIDEQEDSTVRRSNRIRVRPLDWWRQQRPKYKIDVATRCQTIEGIDKGFSVDNPFKPRRTRPTSQERKKPKEKQEKQEKRKQPREPDEERPAKRVRHYAPNEVSIHQQLNQTAVQVSEKIKKEATEFCSQNDLNWNESKQSKGVHIAFMSRRKDRDGNTQATGFMKLAGLLSKPTQRSANYVTKYVVMFGAASVVIDDKAPVILKSMDAFTVNKNTLFSIDNLRKDELLLYFDVSKS